MLMRCTLSFEIRAASGEVGSEEAAAILEWKKAWSWRARVVLPEEG